MGKASRRKHERPRLHPATESVKRLIEGDEERILAMMPDDEFIAEFGITKDQLRAHTHALSSAMEAHDMGDVADSGAAARAMRELVKIGWGK